MEGIRENLHEILENYGVTGYAIEDSSSYVRDLGMDSLDVMELVLLIELKFNVQVPHLEIEKMDTVGETIKFIESQMDSNDIGKVALAG